MRYPLVSVKVRDMIRLLESDGWRLKAMRGSHRQVKHPRNADGRHCTRSAWQRLARRHIKGDFENGRVAGGRLKYAVIYEHGPTSWGAYVPDLPGVISVGDSRDEVARLIQEAIELHLDGMREEGLPIPVPSSFVGEVEVHPAA